MKKLGVIIRYTIEWTLFALLLTLFTITIIPVLPIHKYIATYNIATGSMLPLLPIGSLVFITPIPPRTAEIGDTIAFTSPQNRTITIVHRIYAIEKDSTSVRYKTKGNNNPSEDNWYIYEPQIKGKVVAFIPYLGNITTYVRTVNGFALLIGLPTLIVIFMQIKRIYEGVKEYVTSKKKSTIKIATAAVLLLIVGTTTSITSQEAYALYTTKAKVNNLAFTTFTPNPTATPSATPSPTVSPTSVPTPTPTPTTSASPSATPRTGDTSTTVIQNNTSVQNSTIIINNNTGNNTSSAQTGTTSATVNIHQSANTNHASF